jgi:hypothetical protein
MATEQRLAIEGGPNAAGGIAAQPSAGAVNKVLSAHLAPQPA